MLPAICKFLSIKEDKIGELSNEKILPRVRLFAEKCSCGFSETHGEYRHAYWCLGESSLFWPLEGMFVKYLFNINGDLLIAEFNAGDTSLLVKLKSVESINSEEGNDFQIEYKEMIKNGFYEEEINAVCKTITQEILDLVKKAIKLIEQEERQEGILKLLE